MRWSFLWILLAGFAADGHAQVVSAQDFFTRPPAAITGPIVDPGEAPAMPWIERYELRTETRDFNPAAQEYTLRLLPSTPGKRQAQQALSNVMESRPDFEGEKLACEVTERRYADWLDLFALTQEERLIGELESILRDRETILGRMAGSLDFEWSNLLKTRTDRTDLTLRANQTRRAREQLLTDNGLAADSLDFSGFPQPEQLSFSVLTYEEGETGTADPETLYDIALIERELELERAGQKQYLDFAQFKYRGPGDDFFRERFSVGIGLQLPNRGNDRLKIRELELERTELLQESARDQSDNLADGLQYNRKFNGLLESYAERANAYREEANDFAQLTERMAASAGVDPLFLLNVRERSIRNDLRLLDLRIQITEIYLAALKKSGSLCAEPAGTYLRRF